MHTKKIRGRALVVGAALVLTTTLAPGCSASSPTGFTAASSAEPSPWLLFQQDAGDRQEIALIRLDGTGRTAPLHDLAGGHQTNPDWSPDGQHIVFAMSDGERDDLWVADADGSDAHRLLDCRARCRWLDDPAWSPDGKRIAYSRTVERADGWGIGTLETVSVVSGKVRVELGPWKRAFTSGSRYSPDGRQLVFEKVLKSGRGPESDIDGVVLSVVRLDVAGHPVRSLTDPQLFAATADWSPDGRRIVYSALAETDSPAEDLFWIRPRGGAPTRLTHVADDGGFAIHPTWQQDSIGVIFSGRVDDTAGSPELLSVWLGGSDLGPAFAGDVIYGFHPRVQPVS
jgi:Tol biopolymer transport system component